jgi:hypothetical protein
MKHLIIAIVLVVLATLAYSYFNKTAVESVVTTSDAVNEPSKLGTGKNSLSSTAPSNAAVFIMQPGDGSTVSSPLTVKFGITNMQVRPAGDNTENTGHHHLLINLDEMPELSQPLPATEQIVHFGKGQTETTIELAPGTHSLQLLLGNYLHIPHDQPVISKKISITVE